MKQEEVRLMLESAPPLSNDLEYEVATNAMGREVLHYLEKYPEALLLGSANDVFDMAIPDWRERCSGVTGFMVGWSVNAARFALGHNEVPNPAIVTIKIGE